MTKLYKINTLAVHINTVEGWESLHSCSTGCIGGSLQDQDTLIEQSDTKITIVKCTLIITSRPHQVLFHWEMGNKLYNNNNDGLITCFHHPQGCPTTVLPHMDTQVGYSPLWQYVMSTLQLCVIR